MFFRYLGSIATSMSVILLIVGPWGLVLAGDGELDPAFGLGGKLSVDITGQLLDDAVSDIALLTDGRIVLAGTTSSGYPSEHDVAVTILQPDGTIDESFGQAGRVLVDQGGNDFCKTMAVQQDGRILLAGYTTPVAGGAHESAILRLNPDGTIDLGFGNQGAAKQPLPFAIVELVLLPAGAFLAAGTLTGPAGGDFAIACFDSNGALNSRFGNAGIVIVDFGADEYLTHLSLTPDGRLLAAGLSTTGALQLASLLIDGSSDAAFAGTGKKSIDVGCFYDVAAVTQLDGKIVVGTTIDGVEMPDFLLARLDPDGTLDGGFGKEGIVTGDLSGTDDYLTHVALQPDGKILAVGWAGFYPDFLVQRYNRDGSVDRSFGTEGWIHTDFVGESDRARVGLVRPDGTFLLAGDVPGSGSDESRNFGVACYQFSSQPLSILEVMLSGVDDVNSGHAAAIAAELSDLWVATSQSRPQHSSSNLIMAALMDELDVLAHDEQVPTEWVQRMRESATAFAHAIKQSGTTTVRSSVRRSRPETSRTH